MESTTGDMDSLYQAHTAARDAAKVREMRLKFFMGKLRREFPWAIMPAAAGMAAGVIAVIFCGSK